MVRTGAAAVRCGRPVGPLHPAHDLVRVRVRIGARVRVRVKGEGEGER